MSVIEPTPDTGTTRVRQVRLLLRDICEPVGETSHYGEPDPCDCEEAMRRTLARVSRVEGTCQFID